jgi:ABC-type uncharacterized transport system auxiliary subunit
MRRTARLAVPVLLLLGVQGCGVNLLESSVPVPETYRLGSAIAAAPASDATAATGDQLALTVARPRAAPALDTDRIAVVPAASRFEYYTGVRWAEAAPQMLQQNLVAALDASGRYAGVFASPARVPSELMLDVELRHFEAIAGGTSTAPKVRIQLQASLVDVRRASRIASFVAEADVAAAGPRRADVVAAFERANAQVVADVVQRVATATAALPASTD